MVRDGYYALYNISIHLTSTTTTDDSETLCNTGAEDIVIQRTEPDPSSQEFPCPHQRVQYECTTLRPVAVQRWMLPSGVGLTFTGTSSVGRVVNSSDDQFSVTLTSKMEDPDSDDLFFTSTLLIIDSVNDSHLICSGTPASGNVFQGNTTLVLSGECFNEEVIHRDSMFTPQVMNTC